MKQWRDASIAIALILLMSAIVFARYRGRFAPVSLRELTDVASAQISATNRRSIEFDVVEWTGTGDVPPDMMAQPPNLRTSWRTFRDGGKYRFEREDAPEGDTTTNRCSWFIFNGTYAATVGCNAQHPTVSLIHASPPVGHFMHGWLTWQAWWAFQDSECNSMLDAVSHATSVLSQFDNVSKRITYTFVDTNDPSVRRSMVVGRDPTGIPRIYGASFVRSDGSGERIAASSWEFGPLFDKATGLATTMRFVVTFYGADARWSASTVSLVSTTDVADGSADRFDVPFSLGLHVSDERTQIAYTVGKNELALDGTVLETKEPILGDASLRLDQVVAGAKQTLPIISEQPTSSPVSEAGNTHDFGDVSIDGGPNQVAHAFVVQNDTDSVKKVLRVASSCACVGTAMDVEVIPPHSSARLNASLTVRFPEQVSQRVAVIFEDGSIHEVFLRARGLLTRRLSAFASRTANSDELLLHLVYLDLANGEMPAVPTFKRPNGCQAEFLGWNVIEERSVTRSRPLRCFGRVRLNLRDLQPPYGNIEIRLADRSFVRMSLGNL